MVLSIFTSNDCDYKFGVSFSKEKKEGSFAIINTLRGKHKDNQTQEAQLQLHFSTALLYLKN